MKKIFLFLMMMPFIIKAQMVNTPWFEDFESLVATGYHVLPPGMDATGDVYSWHAFSNEPASSGDIYIVTMGSGTHYLYSPQMNIIAGHSYDISFNYSVSGTNVNDTWDIEVVKGSNKTGASMATVGNAANNQNNHSYLHFKTSFIAGSTTGTYFGIQMYSSSYTFLFIDDFRNAKRKKRKSSNRLNLEL